MASRLAFLIACILFFAAAPLWAQQPQCLKCHPVHYADRGNCVDCHRGNPRTDRANIAHYRLIEARFSHFTIPFSPVLAEGRKLLDMYACRRCHVSGGKGNGFAANLDVSTENSLPGELLTAIQEPAAFMPQFHFPESMATALVNAILGGASEVDQLPSDAPLVIHFEDSEHLEKNVFVTKCGTCHRVLTGVYGGLGSGDTAPNLSGLLTPWYPRNFRKDEAWTRENLENWLKNPRKIRPQSLMPPVPLKEKEFVELIRILEDQH